MSIIVMQKEFYNITQEEIFLLIAFFIIFNFMNNAFWISYSSVVDILKSNN